MLLTPVALATALLTATGTASVPTDPDEALTPFEQSLDKMPATALETEGAMMVYVDMDLAWGRAGIGIDPAERLDRVGALVELPTWTQTPQLFGPYAAQVDEARSEVGFTMFQIEREIAVLAPPNNIMIAETSVTADDVTAAVASDPLWSADLGTVESAGGPYFTWGDDPAAPHVDRISPMRPLGQGGQLAVIADDAGSTVVRTLEPADMEAVLTTAAGTSSSLRDTDFFGAALAALGKGAVLQTIGVPQPQLFDPAVVVLGTEAIEELLQDVVLVPAYDGLLIAELYDGGVSQTELLFVYGAAADAEASAPAFERALAEGVNTTTMEPLSEIFPGASVSTDGPVVVVTLPSEGAYRIAQRMLFERALFPAG